MLSFLHSRLQPQRSSYGVLYFLDFAVRKKDHGFRAAINTLGAFMLRECFAAQLFSRHTAGSWVPAGLPLCLALSLHHRGSMAACLPGPLRGDSSSADSWQLYTSPSGNVGKAVCF